MNPVWRGLTWLPRRVLGLGAPAERADPPPTRITSPKTAAETETEAERRIDEARDRLRAEIPPPEDD